MNLLLAENLGGVPQEELEDLVFTPGCREHVPADGHRAGGAVHAQIAGLQDLGLRSHAPPAQGPNASEHLFEVERLGEVVVGTGVEAGEPVLDVVAGGEHQDRGRRPVEAEMAAEVDAVEITTEHDVEDGDVVGEPGAERFERLLPAQCDIHGHARLRQPASEAPGDLGFVLDDNDAHAGIVFSAGRRIRSASDSILPWMNDVIAADGDLVIRRMRDHPDEHERMVAWRNSPHVREWWDLDDPPLTPAGAIDEYRELTDAAQPTTPCIIELAGVPVGYVQFYPWDAEEEYLATVGLSLPSGSWGLDIFIEGGLAGTGIGSWAVQVLSDHLFVEEAATAVALVTESGNARAHAAYIRAGMRVSGKPFHDTDTRGGQPVESILMIRDRPGGTAGGR
jgi:RimJ/RimL family protein N-acetyltransferase